ncbi:sodium:calcium antiporter [Mariniphaga sediminis]|jgi:K+-dependent Na+/Ca+ exchanger-like protein|uniref:Sodium:calcium antiporter n=1 Tax=Mariniphaga sediminis TaxID=1628158 RepID=A0A399CVQ2_9BACT|nr:calcium/sodium antiporter [Mariniphaga sediminis]RIH63845.1 sodium:calcium antiporter [Mariniphaga sediminis]
MIILYTLALLVCFVLLARIVDLFFIASLDKISHDLRLSSDAAGATLMAIGSSAPELFVALFSVLKPGDHQAIGIGSIVGSAIFNLLVIVGAAALVRKARLTWQPMVRDLFFYTLAVVLLVWFIWDGRFTLTEAIVFLGIYIFYVIAVVYWKKVLPYNDLSFDEREEQDCAEKGVLNIFDRLLCRIFPDKKHYYRVFLLSIFIIAGLSWALVELAVVISYILNIPEAIIALTVLAIGTSVPDLISSMIVARQGRGDMAVSNAIGSNIFDILVGLGLPLAIFVLMSNEAISTGGDISRSAIILFGSVVLLIVWLLLSRWRIGKITGVVFLGIYFLYVLSEILMP